MKYSILILKFVFLLETSAEQASKGPCFGRITYFLTLTLPAPFANISYHFSLPTSHPLCALCFRFIRIFSTSCQGSISPTKSYLTNSSEELGGPSHSSLPKLIPLYGSHMSYPTCFHLAPTHR